MEEKINAEVIGFPKPFSDEDIKGIKTRLNNDIKSLALSDEEKNELKSLKEKNNLPSEEKKRFLELQKREKDYNFGLNKKNEIQNQMLLWAGYSAGICYMKSSWDEILKESPIDTLKRAEQTLKSGHHSVFDHQQVNILFTNLPKILAMLINNENQYTTSEKSGRYTKMTGTSEKEKELYLKWYEIITARMTEVYGDLKNYNSRFGKLGIEKLAQENARYMTSVASPTTLEYSTTVRQLNYLYSWINSFGKEGNEKIIKFLLPMLKELKEAIEIENKRLYLESNGEKVLLEPGLHNNEKNRNFSLLVDIEEHENIKEQFGYSYTLKYKCSFPALGQMQRHRTIDYTIAIPDKPQFYVPPIIKENTGLKSLESEWNTDLKSIEDIFPQGMMVSVCETGTLPQFIEKGKERACIYAQYETREKYFKLNKRMYEALKEENEFLAKKLEPYTDFRCTYPCFKCTNPCKLPNDVKRKLKI